MRKYVEKTIGRKLTDVEYKKVKYKYHNFLMKKIESYPKKERDELYEQTLKWWRTTKRGKTK